MRHPLSSFLSLCAALTTLLILLLSSPLALAVHHDHPLPVSVPISVTAASASVASPLARSLHTRPPYTRLEAFDYVSVTENNSALPNIILIVPPFTTSYNATTTFGQQSIHYLLTSLARASYPSNAPVQLTVYLHADTDATQRSFIASYEWPHGPRSFVNGTRAGDIESILHIYVPPKPSHKEASSSPPAVIFIDAARALAPLHEHWFLFLRSVQRKYARRPDIMAACIQPMLDVSHLELTGVSDREDDEAMLWHAAMGGEKHGVLMVLSNEAWRTFHTWLISQRANWFMWPSVSGLRDKRDERWVHYRHSVHASWYLWLSKFNAVYGLYVLYPRTVDASSLSIKYVDMPAQGEEMKKSSSEKKEREREKVMVNKPLLRVDLRSRRIWHGNDSTIADKRVHKIVRLGRAYRNAISLTVINRDFIDTARSWICNVDAAGFRPPGIVWITTDDDAHTALRDVRGTVAVRLMEMGGASATSFGNPGYWRLMLQRSHLIRAILDHGVAVFAFETDQVWLRDPLPYIESLAWKSGYDVDIVGTIDSSHDIGGNFLYLLPTLATRRVWTEVCNRFSYTYEEYGIINKDVTSRTIIDNDQTLLTRLVLFEQPFRINFPTIFRTLDTDRFVSGRWYDGGKRFYTAPRARAPVVINNNFIEGVMRKTRRLRKHGHWFLDRQGQCNEAGVKRAIDENEYRAKMTKADVQSKEVASLEMAVTVAMHEEEDQMIALADLRPDTEEENQLQERPVARWPSSLKLLKWPARKRPAAHVNVNSKRSRK